MGMLYKFLPSVAVLLALANIHCSICLSLPMLKHSRNAAASMISTRTILWTTSPVYQKKHSWKLNAWFKPAINQPGSVTFLPL